MVSPDGDGLFSAPLKGELSAPLAAMTEGSDPGTLTPPAFGSREIAECHLPFQGRQGHGSTVGDAPLGVPTDLHNLTSLS